MITKVTLTFSDGSAHDFLSIDDAVSMAGTPELHPDAPLPADAPVDAPVSTETEHAAPAEDIAPASGETATPSEDAQQDSA